MQKFVINRQYVQAVEILQKFCFVFFCNFEVIVNIVSIIHVVQDATTSESCQTLWHLHQLQSHTYCHGVYEKW